MRQNDTDVLIVGGGPTGLACALLLARRGIPSIVLERNQGTDPHPRAHELNVRSVEILREVGITEHDLAREASPCNDGARILFCRAIKEELARIDLLLDSPSRAQQLRQLRSEPSGFNLSQPELEKLLVRRAQGEPLISLRFGHAWISSEQHGDGVDSCAQTVPGGESYGIRSRFLLACDGASSACRRAAEIPMQGPSKIQDFVNAYVEMNLRGAVRTPAKLYWILRPDALGVLIAHHIDKRWVYAVPVFTPQERPEDFTPEVMKARLARALGGACADIAISSISTWRMTAQVAGKFRDGRLFLAGDAAHRFPPTGGLGMNTGIGDAHNLCWKLADVLRGGAGAALLDTYECERRPVALANCEASLRNYEKMFDVPRSVGLNPENLDRLTRFMARAPMRYLSPAWKDRLRQVLSLPVDFLFRLSLRKPAVRHRLDVAVAAQVAHFNRLGLELGYQYREGAVIPGAGEGAARGDADTAYVPSLRAGVRLPHVWLSRENTTCSTHDLVDYGSFVLLTRTHEMKERFSHLQGNLGEGLRCHTYCIAEDGDLRDPSGEWEALWQATPGDAVLVRPDGHLACRLSGNPDAVAETLRFYFNSLGYAAPIMSLEESPT